MVLGKLPVPGRPTSLEKSRARAYCTCSGAGGGCLVLLSSILSPLSPSLWETVRYRLKYCLKGSLSAKTTNQLICNLDRVMFIFYPTHNKGLLRLTVEIQEGFKIDMTNLPNVDYIHVMFRAERAPIC